MKIFLFFLIYFFAFLFVVSCDQNEDEKKKEVPRETWVTVEVFDSTLNFYLETHLTTPKYFPNEYVFRIEHQESSGWVEIANTGPVNDVSFPATKHENVKLDRLDFPVSDLRAFKGPFRARVILFEDHFATIPYYDDKLISNTFSLK
ncbi:MAG: hypothetical protein J0L62_05700 [Bacteroidetes bacterium]|nr:hypothetical protein [Bacteroidota bacterium]